jgi:hypothetical protein
MASSDFPRFLAPTLFALGCGLVPQSALGQDSCGAPNTNSCCVASLTPGCGDAWCCEFVCSIDPFCCTNQWDAICANITIGTCDGCFGGSTSCGDPEAGNCCIPQPGPFCSDEVCCNFVCLFDIVCCETAWDDVCAEQALKVCDTCQPTGGGCGEPNANDCCEANETGGCADEKCCALVCALDPVCCSVSWDGKCVKLADALCTSCKSLVGDLNADGVVNSADLAILLSSWGSPNADLNGDGITGSPDLTILLNNWS